VNSLDFCDKTVYIQPVISTKQTQKTGHTADTKPQPTAQGTTPDLEAFSVAAHTMFDGRLQIYKRPNGRSWNCAARVGGQRFRITTGVELLEQAKDVAEEWYLGLRGKLREGRIVPKERTFSEAADEYMREARVLTIGARSPRYIEVVEMRLNAHVLPYFKDKPLSEITKGLVQSYRFKRAEETIAKTTIKGSDGKPDIPGKPPARSTMIQEIVVIRQVLKHAEGLGWIKYVPNLSTAYMTQGKKGRRAWFDPDEYVRLYKATDRRIEKETRRGWKPRYEDLHDYVLIMANTGWRPDESWNVEFRDVKIEEDYGTKETILVTDIRGKTGVRYNKSMPQAVFPFERLRRHRIERLEKLGKTPEEIEAMLPTMKLFPNFPRHLFNEILREENLKYDRDGRVRTAYSLRHTYISMRMREGANALQTANNCGTSIQMLEEHYAKHIQNRIDASAINVMRPSRARKAEKKQTKTVGEQPPSAN
jgi:Phage integrase, N-terminal SAM-like domain